MNFVFFVGCCSCVHDGISMISMSGCSCFIVSLCFEFQIMIYVFPLFELMHDYVENWEIELGLGVGLFNPFIVIN